MGKEIDLTKNTKVMLFICEAIGSDFDLVDKVFEKNHKKCIVEFKVNGVELDFENVVKSFSEIFNSAAEKEAENIVKEKYYDIIQKAQKVIDMLES